MTTTSAEASVSPSEGFGSNGYRGYVLGALLLAYILNFIDRVIIAYLSKPIIEEFGLAYWQFGLLSGIAFATFYTFLGIPIARLAEHFNRVWIIGVSIIFWSIMTALCGLATSFIMLLIFRLGVGVGEAGLTPPANSLIADYFKPKSRPVALAIYSTGITIGSLCAALFVALLLGVVTWRETFIAIGLCGIPVGVIFLLTVKEPPRGYTDPPGTVKPKPPGILEVAKSLSTNPTFWHITIGSTLASFIGYGLLTFSVEFLTGTFKMSVQDVALRYLVPLSVTGAIGTWMCGALATRFGGLSLMWLPAIALPTAMIFHLLALNIPVPTIVFLTLIVANLAQYFYLGPMYAVSGAVVNTRSRATAIAILLFVVNLIGYGLGPLFTGAVGDYMIATQLAAIPELDLATCTAGLEALGETAKAQCAEAKAWGIRRSMSITVLFFLWAAVHFYLAMKTYAKDAANATGPAEGATT